MESNILNYLDKNYSELKQYIEYIDINVFNEPYSVIVKGRIFSEKLAIEIGKFEGINGIEEKSQADRLRILKYEADLDRDIEDIFHVVRKTGNLAAHDNVEGELSEALRIHRCVYKLIGWFIEVYLDPEFNLPPYKEPKQNNDGVESGMLKNLFNKFNKALDNMSLKSKEDNIIPEDKIEVIEAKEITELETEDVKVSESLIKEVTLNESTRECLIDELSRLKESSKEAVEGLNKFSDFKKYMHIERDVQRNLEDLIMNSEKSESAQLILVCGSVGDGKSHIISYFKDKYPNIIRKFKLHNDATESLEPNETSMDTLNKVLDQFSDEKIDTSIEKFILAINLGTLNNFIDSKYGERFTKLKKFVEDNKILESTITSSEFNEKSSIQFVNFCDYHLYTLKDGKVKSEYIKELLGRLTNKSELNSFYKSYKENCSKCINKDKCPIKANYELLALEDVQDSIIELLVQIIIKNKTIISTRALLNFLHDILISRAYIDINSPTFKQKINRLRAEDYIKALMPNILFSHKELSSIFESINKLDPLNIRNEQVDDFIIKFNNTVDILQFFVENIDFPKGYLGKIEGSDFEGSQGINKLKMELLKLFIRSYKLCGKGEIFSLNDEVYDEFIRNLYFWNKGEKSKLKDLYSFIKEGVIKWNGEADKNNINIFIGKNQIKYKVSEEIEFKPDVSNLPNDKDVELIKFLNTMEIRFKSDRLEHSEGVDIDYSLYDLLKKITNGYRPNKKDRNQFIKFIEFINKLELAGSQDQSITFTEKNRDENKKYRLEYDDEFEMYRFVEI